jgi:tungstate transport system ATP-binding protein
MRAPASDLPIVFDKVTVRAGAAALVDNIDLLIGPGGPTVLLGPNGSGKTTLIRLALGLTAPSEGSLTWGGKKVGSRRRSSVVFQRPVMLRRSVSANLSYVLKGYGFFNFAKKRERIAKLLDSVGLSALGHRPARRLSGGETQRLALARALARSPEILFLDEPTASLDPAAAKGVEQIISAIAASGIKVIMSTHDLGQARRLANDIVFLVQGRLVERNTAANFFTQPSSEEAARFLRGDHVV